MNWHPVSIELDLELKTALTAAEREQLFEWADRVFPAEGSKYSWSQPTHHVVAYESGNPVAHLGFGRYEIIDGGHPVAVIGVGGVVVRPECQGKRIPQRLFDFLHRASDLDARDTPCTLFCPARLEPYYAKHGYRIYTGEVYIPGDGGSNLFEFRFMYCGDVEFSPTITLLTDPW